jgi:pimeloyl-ACP methyl ester carboxylesterase
MLFAVFSRRASMNLTTTVDGTDVALRRLEGRGPTLVLLHDAGRNHFAWDDVLPRLGDLDVVVPSLPGRAGSDGPPLESTTRMVRWVRILLAKLGVSRAVVCGHGLGGAVALELAADPTLLDGRPSDPERTRLELAGVVLASCAAKSAVPEEVIAAVERAKNNGLAADLVPWLWAEEGDGSVLERENEAAGQTPPATAAVDWHAFAAFDRGSSTSSAPCPALVLAGTADRVVPADATRALADRLGATARFELLDGAAHMLPCERHDTVAKLLHDFVHSVQ